MTRAVTRRDYPDTLGRRLARTEWSARRAGLRALVTTKRQVDAGADISGGFGPLYKQLGGNVAPTPVTAVTGVTITWEVVNGTVFVTIASPGAGASIPAGTSTLTTTAGGPLPAAVWPVVDRPGVAILDGNGTGPGLVKVGPDGVVTVINPSLMVRNSVVATIAYPLVRST